MASAVMSYHAITVLEEEQHLRVPVVCRQRQLWLNKMG
jgi:hypothetical protein